MKIHPLLSIIIPVYQTEKFLERCFESVLHQTYQNIEIIVVNDASLDNSDEIIKKYAESDKRFQYIKNAENLGLFQARLRGYEKATGEYIASLDSDDFVGPDYYRMMLTAACVQKADIVLSNMTTYYQDSGERYHRTYGNYAVENIDLSGDAIARTYFDMDAEISQWWFVWNKVYTKELWDRCHKILKRFQGHHIMLEDFIYGTVFMTNARHVVSISCNDYFYVRHEEASTGSGGGTAKIRKNVWDIVDAFKFIKLYLDEIGSSKESKEFLENACSRWRITWEESIRKADITKQEKSEILTKLNEIPTYLEKTEFHDIWSGYFYREISNYNYKLSDLKEKIGRESTHLVCINIPNTLFGNIFGQKTFFKILRFQWKKKYREDILELLRIRQRTELYYPKRDENKDFCFSLNDIYESVKLVSTADRELIERVKTFEADLILKYTYLRQDIYDLISYCVWIKKDVVLLNDSIYRLKPEEIHAETAHLRIYHLPDIQRDIIEELCEEFQASPDQIIFLGDRKSSIYRHMSSQNVICFEIENINTLAQKNDSWNKNFDSLLNGSIDWHRQEDNGINGIDALRYMLQFENPFLPEVKKSVFCSNPYMIGMAAIGPHIMSVLGWLGNISKNHNINRICFLGKDTAMYDKCLKYIQASSCVMQDLTASRLELCAEKIILSWVLWPEDYDETYHETARVRIEDLMMFLHVNGFSTEQLEKSFIKYGIMEDMRIETYTTCMLLHQCFKNEFRQIEKLKYLYTNEVTLPSDCIIFSTGYRKVELTVLRRFNKENVIFTKLFPDHSGENSQNLVYYRKDKLIDYPIRTYLYKHIFSDDKCFHYRERFLVTNMEKGILKYLKTYLSYFEDMFDVFLPYYTADDSGTFEQFINFPAQNDRLLFDIAEWCDYERKSKPTRLLSNVWWDKLNQNHLLDTHQKGKTKVVEKIVTEPQKGNAYSIYYKGLEYPLDQIGRLERICLYWLFDKDRINYKAHKYAASRVFLLPLLRLFGKRIKPQKDCLYIATSNYNLLCCIIHKVIYYADTECDLALSVWRKDKVKTLEAEKFFRNIYIMDDNHFRNMTWQLDEEIKGASKKQTDYLVEGFYDKFYEELPIRLLEYKHIVATNTIMPVTVLLQKLHLPYDCMEEAAGLYSNNELLMNNMRNFHPKSEVYALDKYKMFNMAHVRGKRFVNVKAQEADYCKKNVVDFNVISNLRDLDDRTRSKILNVFSAKEALQGEAKETCLLLTYPLSTRCGLTEQEHIEVYRLLMDIFCENKVVHFKPHPDDKVNYDNYFENEQDFRLINKQILSELVEFETKTNYIKAITTVSTSTNNLQNAEQKIVFGKAFETDYGKLLPYYAYYAFLQKTCPLKKCTILSNGMYTEMLCNIFQYTDGHPSDMVIREGSLVPETKSNYNIVFLANPADLKWDYLGSDTVAVIDSDCSPTSISSDTHQIYKLLLRAERANRKLEFPFTAVLPTDTQPFRGNLAMLPRTGFTITII